MVASVVSFIEWFNKENIDFLSDDMKCEVHIACYFDYMNDVIYDNARDLKSYYTLLRGSLAISFCRPIL